jgi:hypothetical protein
MKKHMLTAVASILALSAPAIAKAQLYVTADIGGVPTVNGATLENFDEPSPPNVTFAGNANLVTGSLSQIYLAPYFSGSTAAYFGESPASGYDGTQYVALEADGSATFSFSNWIEPRTIVSRLCIRYGFLSVFGCTQRHSLRIAIVVSPFVDALKFH